MKNVEFHRVKMDRTPPGSQQPIMVVLYTRDHLKERSSLHRDKVEAYANLIKEGIRKPENMEIGVEYVIAQRGVLHTGRQYRDFDQDEREQIIEDFLTIGSKATRQKWNISSSVLHHIRWHNKEAEEEIEDRHFAKAGL